MNVIGYSLVRLADGAEVHVVGGLPARISVEGVGVVDFDKPGLVIPDSESPTHKLVERICAAPPEGRYDVTGETAAFDGDDVVVKRTYQALPDPVPPQISDRQFAHALWLANVITHEEAMAFVQTGTIPAALEQIIAAIPDELQRQSAALLVAGATSFERNHPMTEALRLGMGKTAEEIDDLWREGASL